MDNIEIMDKLDWEGEYAHEYYEKKPKLGILYLWHKELAQYVYVLAFVEDNMGNMGKYWTYKYYIGNKAWAERQAKHYHLYMPKIKNIKGNK